MTRKKNGDKKNSNENNKAKIMCLKRQKLVVDGPEEKVRQEYLKRLTQQMDYDMEDIEVEWVIPIGRKKPRADIVIFNQGSDHDNQANILCIIECKRPDLPPSDKRNGVNQAKSYAAACLNCQWCIWVGDGRQAFEIVRSPQGKKDFLKIGDLPNFGEKNKAPTLRQLNAELSPMSLLNGIHDLIHSQDGFAKDKAFMQLSFVLLSKKMDEETGEPLTFYVLKEEKAGTVRKRIDDLFEKVKTSRPTSFETNDRIEFSDRVLVEIVRALHLVSLTKTPSDMLGAAYQTLIGSNLRGDRGEFWTPDDVVKLMVEMLWALMEKDDRADDLVAPGSVTFIDPFCGTGRFPYEYAKKLRMELKSRGRTTAQIKTQMQQLVPKSISGVDIQPQLVRTSTFLVEADSGVSQSNFGRNDSLQTPIEDWEMKNLLTKGSIDIGGTNPPFGSKLKIDDYDVLKSYELSTTDMELGKRRNSLPPEVLSIERCVDLLAPGGYFAMVLPDNIPTTPSMSFVRKWLHMNVEVVATVDLPVETFIPGGTGTQTTVIVFRKPVAGPPSHEGDIFMTIVTSVGYNKRGKPTFKTNDFGEIVEDEDGQGISDNQLPDIVDAFRKHLALGDAKHSLFSSQNSVE
jgi:type I restriction enzyme M protein